MVGRDLGQLLGTNLMVCVLCLPAALGVSLGVTLLSRAADGGVQRSDRPAGRPCHGAAGRLCPAQLADDPLSGCPGQSRP